MQNISKIYFCGIGANTFLYELLAREFPDIRFEIIDGLRFHGSLDPNTLVIVSSLSGSTSEVLCILEDLLHKPANNAYVVFFTRGGILEHLSKKLGIPLILIQNQIDEEYGGIWQLYTLFSILRDSLKNLGLYRDNYSQIVPIFSSEEAKRIAKQIVEQVVNHNKEMKEITVLSYEEDYILARLIQINLSELCYANISCAKIPDYMHHSILSFTRENQDGYILCLYRDIYPETHKIYFSEFYQFISKLRRVICINFSSKGDISDFLGILFLTQLIALGIIKRTRINAKHLMEKFKIQLRDNYLFNPEQIQHRILERFSNMGSRDP